MAGDARQEPQTAQGEKIPEVDPEHEPELVGAHSGLAAPRCQNWVGETKDEIERCGAEATHTVVYFTGKLHTVARCDDCGIPEDVDGGREWSGDLEAEA